MDAIYKPLAVVTLPTPCQPETSWYSHDPCVTAFAVLPTISTPANVLAEDPPVTASVASLNTEPNRPDTVSPGFRTVGSDAEVAWSSKIEDSPTDEAVRVGASLTGATRMSNEEVVVARGVAE